MKIGLEKMAQLFMFKKKVLELGPGTGRISLEVLPEFNGIDQSLPMLKLLQNKIKKGEYFNAKLIHGDIMKIKELCSRDYDVIFENGALSFALDPLKVIDQIFIILKPKGIFLRVNEFWKQETLHSILSNVFHATASKLSREPFIVRGFEAHKKATYYLLKQGIKTRKEFIASCKRNIYLGEFIQLFKDRTFTELARLSDKVIDESIEAVRKEAQKHGINNDNDYFIHQIELYCYISEKK